MQATLIIEGACGQAVGRVSIDTADLGIPWAWAQRGDKVNQLLVAHRRGFCSVYKPESPHVQEDS